MDFKMKNRDFILECIQLYRELPALWNIKAKDYQDRAKKNAAYETLLAKYKEVFPLATKEDVKKKINSLRTNYRKELKKHTQSMKSGCSTDDVYQPTLWYFNEMCFLQDLETASDSQSSMENDSVCNPGEESDFSSMDNKTQEDTIPVGADRAPSTSYAVPKSKKKKLDDELMELAAKRQEKPDEFENWALACAADIKKMEPMQQIFAKNAIAAVIMEGQLGLLHRNSVKINSPYITISKPPTSMHTRSTPAPSFTNIRATSTPMTYSNMSSRQYFIKYSPQNPKLPPEQSLFFQHDQNQQNIVKKENCDEND